MLLLLAAWFTLSAVTLCEARQQTATGPVMDNSDSLGSSTAAGKSAPPMHSTGIRGSIDSGGYSAPGVARTQTALRADLLRLQLEALKPAYCIKVTFPCGMEASLAEAARAQPANFAATYQGGTFYLQHAEPAKASDYLEKAHQAKASDANVTRLLAIADLQLQRPADALDLISQAPGGTENAELRILAGIAAKASGKAETAEEQFRIAAQDQPSKENLFAWGTELLLLGRVAQAAGVFHKAMAQYPQSTMLELGAAAAIFDEGNSAGALQMLLRVAEKNPASPAAFVLIGSILQSPSIQTPPELKAQLSRFAARAPDNSRANFAYALVLLRDGGSADPAQLRAAEDLLKRATAIDPSFAEAYFKLGTLYAERADYALAVPEFRKATEADPDFAEAHYRLGQAYMRSGQAVLAEKEFAAHQKLRAQTDSLEDATNKFLMSDFAAEMRSARCPASLPEAVP